MEESVALTLLDAHSAPLGSRVQFTRAEVTMSGVRFEPGDLATVTTQRLTSSGEVVIEVTTEDNRSFLTGFNAPWTVVDSEPVPDSRA